MYDERPSKSPEQDYCYKAVKSIVNYLKEYKM